MDEFEHCAIKTPENVLGEVIGELNRIGAWIHETKRTEIDEFSSVVADVPTENLQAFVVWFQNTSQGDGVVETNT